MRTVSMLRICAAVVVLSVVASARAEPQAHLQLWSTPGDYIGQGKTFDYTYAPSRDPFFAGTSGDIGGVPTYLTFSLGTVTSSTDTNTWSLLQFSTAALGIGIQPGFYDNAERAPFASLGHAGLDVSFQNRGCNNVKGSLDIQKAQFTGNQIDHFSVGFVQHCEGGPSFLTGEFSFDRVPPVTAVPEPSSYALLAAGLVAMVATVRRRRVL